MVRKIKITIFLTACLCLYSCNESPHIDFHSYQELSEYDFIRKGWFPEILKDDAFSIKESYDVNNKHLFGKFDFKNRPRYDSIFNSYLIVEKDSLLEKIEDIHKPRCPKWFVPKEYLTEDKYLIRRYNDFYLIMEKKANRIYFLR
jgi:hypothetical protein